VIVGSDHTYIIVIVGFAHTWILVIVGSAHTWISVFVGSAHTCISVIVGSAHTCILVIVGSAHSRSSFLAEFMTTSSRKADKRYFWQYNTQAKGPKGKRLCKTVRSDDPHVLNDFEDPVFDPEQNQTR